MPGIVRHGFVGYEAFLLCILEEFRTWERVGHGDLNGLAIKPFGELDSVADRLPGLARQAQNEVAMDNQLKLLAVMGEVERSLDACSLLDVLQDLRIARLEPDDEQSTASLFHGLERVKVGGDARVTGPGKAEGFELFTQFNCSRLLDVEGVVVEEE